MLMFTRFARIGCYVCMALFMTGCAPSFYMVKNPTPSALQYVVAAPQATDQLVFIDERKGNDKTFSTGILPATLKVSSTAIDPPKFLAKGVEDELRSRGLTVTTATVGDALPKVHLQTFRVQNHRSSGFSPFFTFTYIGADLETASGTKRITAYVRRGKVPVWSFDEVIEPTFNQPLSIAIKEFSSKLAKVMYGYQADDDAVKRLQDKIAGPRTDLTYLDVYALGFTNNPLAVGTLVTLTGDTDEYVRQAAISSLGTIGATEQFALLKGIYEKTGASRQDRDMAIKAIADLGTKESSELVAAELKRVSGLTDTDSLWTARVLALYY
jgi:hypothetical protein